MIATAQAQVMFGEDFEGEYEAALEAYVEKNPDAGMTALPAPDIALEDQANKSLRAVKFWNAEREHLEQQVKDEVGRLQLWLKTEQDRIDRRIRWHEDGLRDFLVRSGKRSVKLAYGAIKWSGGRKSIKIENFAQVIFRALNIPWDDQYCGQTEPLTVDIPLTLTLDDGEITGAVACDADLLPVNIKKGKEGDSDEIIIKASKVAIAKHIKETGEIPDGTDLVAGEDTFTVDTKD